MLSFVLDSNFRIVDRVLNDVVEYSTVKIEVMTTSYNEGDILVFNLIRPDGKQTPEVYFEMVEGISPVLFKWEANISPYHTIGLPAEEKTGKIILNLTLKKVADGVIQYIKSSPIVRINVLESNEPVPNEIAPSLFDEVMAAISSIKEATTNHDRLTPSSRRKENSHPIAAITGLKEKIGVHIGASYPMRGEETWFQELDAPSPEEKWEVVFLDTVLSEGDRVPFNDLGIIYPMRLKVEGEIFGEVITQYIYNEGNLTLLKGELIIFMGGSGELDKKAYLEVEVTPGDIFISTLFSTGGEAINSLKADLEVYK